MRPFARELGALYALHGVNLVVPFVLVPYLTRALGAESYGVVAFGQAFVGCFLIVVEWGFAYAATREIAVARDDPATLARVAAAVWGAKITLLGLGFVVVAGLVAAVPALRAHATVHLLLYGTVAGPALLPLWLFRGLERTSLAAGINAGARLGGLALTILVVKAPGDAPLYAGVLGGQGLVAGVAGVVLARKVLGVRLGFPGLGAVRAALRRTGPLFVSNVASSLTTSINPFLLGLFASYAEVGLYGGAERVMFGAVSLLAPIGLAGFPRASHLAATDRGLALGAAGRLLVLTLGAALGLGVALVLGAEPIARLYLGPGFAAAAPTLRVLGLVVPALAAIGVLGGQIMVAFGRDRAYRNVMTVTVGAHLAAAALLAPGQGALGMAIAFAASSALAVVLMVGYLWRARLLPGTA